MIDYLLRFPNKEAAIQFGLATGFTTEADGEFVSSPATADYALHVIGEHFDADGNSDGKWWVMVRDLKGMDLPAGAADFIVWHSAMVTPDGNPPPRPTDAPGVVWA